MSKEGPEKLGKDSSGSLRKERWGPSLPLCDAEETSASLARGESPPKNSVGGSRKVFTGWTIGSGWG